MLSGVVAAAALFAMATSGAAQATMVVPQAAPTPHVVTPTPTSSAPSAAPAPNPIPATSPAPASQPLSFVPAKSSEALRERVNPPNPEVLTGELPALAPKMLVEILAANSNPLTRIMESILDTWIYGGHVPESARPVVESHARRIREDLSEAESEQLLKEALNETLKEAETVKQRHREAEQLDRAQSGGPTTNSGPSIDTLIDRGGRSGGQAGPKCGAGTQGDDGKPVPCRN